MIYGDGPTPEEVSLWADLAEVAEERDRALSELASERAENARLRALLSTRHDLAA